VGYSTYYDGYLEFNRPLMEEEVAHLSRILDVQLSDVLTEEDREGAPDGGRAGWIDIAPYEAPHSKNVIGITHNNAEKTYYFPEQVAFVQWWMNRKFPDLKLNGQLLAQGEDIGDVWWLVAKDGEISTLDVELADREKIQKEARARAFEDLMNAVDAKTKDPQKIMRDWASDVLVFLPKVIRELQ